MLSAKSNGINTTKLTTIYKSLVLSKLQYSMLPFLIKSKLIRQDLQIIQNTCLKIITRQPKRTNTRLLHNTLKIDKLDKRLAIMSANYLANAKQNNETIKKMIDNHNETTRTVKGFKRSILDKFNRQTLAPLLSTTQFI
jgi:hypothetical protein